MRIPRYRKRASYFPYAKVDWCLAEDVARLENQIEHLKAHLHSLMTPADARQTMVMEPEEEEEA